MSSSATDFLDLPNVRPADKRNIVRVVESDSSEGDKSMPPRRTGERAVYDSDSIEGLMRMFLTSQTAFMDAQAARVQAQAQDGNGYGKKALYLPIMAAVLISMVPSAFNAVWWTRGTERDTAATIMNHQNEIIRLREDLKEVRDTQATEKTWNEKMRNNLAAMGIIVDPVTAEAKRKGR